MARSAMRRVSLRNLAAHKVRLFLTVLSVVLGTAFITGSFVFTDTLQRTFESIFDGNAAGVDVRISAQEASQSGSPMMSGVPLSVEEQARDLPDVARAVPSVSGTAVLLDSSGAAVQTGGAPTEAEAYYPPEQAIGEPLDFVEGTGPSSPGQVAINESGAKRAGLEVGDTARILIASTGNTVDLEVTGIYSLPTDAGGYISLRLNEAQALQLFSDGEHVNYIDLKARDGVSAEELRDEVARLLPDLKVQTGAEVAAEQRDQLASNLSFFNYFLLAFGLIALVVGTFIIYNTFAMIVAQRLRELALLRAVGASRGQVSRSVLLEAAVVGLIGSVLGLLAGIGLTYGLRIVLEALNLGLPQGPLALKPRTVVAAFAVGVLITMLSAYAPARRASRIPPVAAMREEFASPGETLRRRTVIGAVLGIASLAAVVVGALGSGKEYSITVGVGAGLGVLAVLLGSPALSRPFVGGLGRVVGAPFGPIGRLARTNGVRNPRRTAATAFALTLGLLLVTVIGVLGSSAKSSIDALIDRGVEADLVLTGPMQIGVPSGAEETAREVQGVNRVAALRAGTAGIGEQTKLVISPDAPLDGFVRLTPVEGSMDLSPGTMMISKDEKEATGWQVGQTIDLGKPAGGTVPVTLAGVYENSQLVGSRLVAGDVYDQLTPPIAQRTLLVLVDVADGADPQQVRTDLVTAMKRYVVVQVQDREEYKDSQAAQINLLLALLYALLALAVVIAILGIVNTLALSVVERRREIGMLRAVGMLRKQVRRTIYLESVLIAVFGAVVGVALGLAFGVAFVRTLANQGLDVISVPWVQVVAMLVGSGLVGVFAALWPAVRAARTKPLEAIADV